MKIFIISDTHFGVRNSSKEWLKLMVEWWDKKFVETIKNNYTPGDYVLHLGDLFDIRPHTDELVRHTVKNLIKKFVYDFPVNFYIMAGNHDVYYKSTNEVSSLDSLEGITSEYKEFKIVKEPLDIIKDDIKISLVPWESNIEKLENNILKAKGDYLFLHTDINEMRYGKEKNRIIENGINRKLLDNFKKIFSGHIHWRSKKGKVEYVGSPYELNKSDIGNEKYITILNLEDGSTEYVLNDYSPKFKIINYENEESFKGVKNNDFVEVLLNNDKIEDFKNFIKEKGEKLKNYDVRYVNTNVELENTIDIKNALVNNDDSYIKNLIINLEKENVKNLLLEVYKEFDANYIN